jgi:hypothetical protein
MFDRLAMQFYADKCMQLAARPVQTGDRLTEDQLREMYARAKAMTEGAWIDMMGRALLAASTASDKHEAVKQDADEKKLTRWQRAQMAFGGGDVPDAAPLAQSAEQDRIDAAVELFDARMAHIGGCTDGGCVIVRPKGMHTNGGCKCPQNKYKMQRAMYAAIDLRNALKGASK